MPAVSAGPNEYLLAGRGGRLENRGSAVNALLRPGTVYVLVPSAKQEASFEFTQETRDGIPLRFKGILIYRITDPVRAASLFDFGIGGRAGAAGGGVDQISALLTHVCLGELRDAVSHMTMAECIEGRRTTLSRIADAAVHATAGGAGMESGSSDARAARGGWGIDVEVAQVAQVFIVDPELRLQLEAAVRNEIRLASDQSDLQSQEAARLAHMASDDRVAEQKLAADRESLRREEALDLARVARQRRMEAEQLATERQTLELERERTRARMAAEQDRLEAQTPVRLLKDKYERAALVEERETRRVRNEVRALEVDHDLALRRAEQALRAEILPLEQAPQVVESASRVLRGANLSVYGEDGRLIGQLEPILALLGQAVERALRGQAGPVSGPHQAQRSSTQQEIT